MITSAHWVALCWYSSPAGTSGVKDRELMIDVLNLLKKCKPLPLASAEVAAMLEVSVERASKRLQKLVLQGKVTCENKTIDGRSKRAYLAI